MIFTQDFSIGFLLGANFVIFFFSIFWALDEIFKRIKILKGKTK